MKFDSIGLPSEGKTYDMQDSIRLAGLLAVFKHPQAVDMRKYILPASESMPRYLVPKEEDKGVLFRDPINPTAQFTHAVYVRHPAVYIYDLSRDQFLIAIAALKVQGLEHLVDVSYVNGRDILWFQTGHIKICKGLKPSRFDNLKMWAMVFDHAKRTPLDECNQLLCMMMLADPKFLKWWCKENPIWRDSINIYWMSWRNEPELCQHMIKTIEEKIK